MQHEQNYLPLAVSTRYHPYSFSFSVHQREWKFIL